MRVDRHFIKQQYGLCRHVTDVAELQEVYRLRDREWPVVWDTETTSLDYGLPSVLYDPTNECVLGEELYPQVFGVSLAFVIMEHLVRDGNGMYLCWARRGSALYDAAVGLLADEADKVWHNAKYDLRVCEANGLRVGGQQDCTLVMSRLFWDRRRSHSLKKLTEFLAPSLSCWDSPIDKEMKRLKSKYTRLVNQGEIAWYDGVSYANYSFVPEVLMSKYATLDVFMTAMLFLRLQGEAIWR